MAKAGGGGRGRGGGGGGTGGTLAKGLVIKRGPQGMSRAERGQVLRNLTPAQYFRILRNGETSAMDRRERSLFRQRASGLRQATMTSGAAKAEWNRLARAVGRAHMVVP